MKLTNVIEFFHVTGHLDIVQYLIGEGCDPNKADMYGVTPLHIAAMTGNVAAVNILVKGNNIT